MEAPRALDVGPECFDGVEVGRVGWQEQEFAALCFDEFDGCSRFVEGGIVQHDDAVGGQIAQQAGLQPEIEEGRIAGAGERQWRNQVAATIAADQACARTCARGLLAVHAPAVRRTPMRPPGVRGKTRFIDKDDRTLSIPRFVQPLEKPAPAGFIVFCLSVDRRFFSGAAAWFCRRDGRY